MSIAPPPLSDTAIPELDAGDWTTFQRDYFQTEQPVIFRGVTVETRDADEIRQSLCQKINSDSTVTHRLLWFDVPPHLIGEVCPTPPVVAGTLDKSTAFLRENCVRVWFNNGGHTTPWHYDGHSLHVFNLQLKGKKRWTIVGPETPLMNMPMSKTCVFEKNSLVGKRHYEFDLNEGDMVFLPRYWFHHVHSIGDMNVNVNWVLMPKQQPPDTMIARRESELLWLMDKLRPVLPAKTRGMLDTFAGVGGEALHNLTDHVPAGRGLMRAVKEIARSPVVLLAIPTQIGKATTVLRSQKKLKEMLQSAKT